MNKANRNDERGPPSASIDAFMLAVRACFTVLLRLLTAAIVALVLPGHGIAPPFVKHAEPQSAQWIVDIV